MKIEYEAYVEAKAEAIKFMAEERVTGISINKKKYGAGWVLEVRECCEDFFKKHIKTS